MAETPQGAVEAHTAAINAKSREQLAASVRFPFVHIQPDGTMVIAADASDLPDPARMPFGRTEVESQRILATSGDLLVYELTFQRYDEHDQPLLRVMGLWGVARGEDGWRVAWRQYLGPLA